MENKNIPFKPNKEFKYSITYTITTEDSAEMGEYADSGFEVEPTESTIGEIIKMAHRNYGIYNPISLGRWESTSPIEDTNYFEKGESKYFNLHIINVDGSDLDEEEHEFITYLLTEGEFDQSDYEDFGMGGSTNSGLSWHQDRARYNKSEDYEIPMSKRKFAKGGGVENVWIALSKTKNGLLLSERFDNQVTHKQLFDYYKKSGHEIIDSNIFKVTNKDVLDVFKDAISKYIKEKYDEVVDWENTLLSYEIVGDRIIAQSCFVETKNGNEYKITPNDLVNNKFADGGGVENMFVVYTENEDGYYRKLSEHKTYRGAKQKMDNLWNEGEYDKMGVVSLEDWNKDYEPYKYSDGGDISEEANLRNRISNLKRLYNMVNESEKADLKYTIDNLEAQQRNLHKMEKGGSTEYNHSWHFDHDRHNKSEDYEIPMSKRKFAEGGGVDEEEAVEQLWKGYASAILFAESDSDTEEPLDANYSISDFDEETIKSSKDLIRKFYLDNKKAIKDSGLDLDTIGNDIWYTRAGHGVGFFDHSLDKDIEYKLTKGAKSLGEYPSVETYDGKISVRGGRVFDDYAKGGSTNSGLSWHQDHARHNKSEDYEIPMSKRKFAEGGGVEDWMETALNDLKKQTGFDDLEIEYPQEKTFSASNGDVEYLVCQDDDVAEELAIERVTEDMNENPEYFNRDFIMNHIDSGDFFENIYREWNMGYATDISTEDDDQYGNRLIAEMVEWGIMSKEDAKGDDAEEIMSERMEDFVEAITEDQLGQDKGFQYYVDNFGEEEAFNIAIDNGLIDVKEASEEAVSIDGIGHFLSSYDGKMLYLENGSVAFRNN